MRSCREPLYRGDYSFSALPNPLLEGLILLVVLVVAALARLPDLGYSQFQGDEGVIMRRAAQALAGDEEQLFLHQKGPVEILMPLAVWALTDTLNEAQARWPFALAGLLAVAGVTRLATRCSGRRAGLAAGLLMAISGFPVAFARIVQYQSVVMAMGSLGLLAFLAYARHGRLSDVLVGAALLAYGLLAHYDAVLVAPAALALVIMRLLAERRAWRPELGRLALAGMLGVAVLALFYAPFVTHPNFAKTFAYLAGERVGNGGPLYNNTARVWVMSTFYNSTYYIVGLLSLATGGLLLGGRRLILKGLKHSPSRSKADDENHVSSQNVGANLRVRPRADCLPLPRIIEMIQNHDSQKEAGDLLAGLYFLAPFVFYLFLVFDPRTHIYTFYPGATLLAGSLLSAGWERACEHRRTTVALAAAGAAWYVVCAAYIGLVFINHTPEYKREWPASQSAWYPTTYEQLPLFGFFGFPYQAGWKAVEGLYAQGMLTGVYASNEEPEITTWYVRSGTRTLCPRPDQYIVAEHVQDEVSLDWDALQRDYHLWAQVTVAGRPKLRLYRPGAPATGLTTYAAEDFAPGFDLATRISAQLPPRYGGRHAVNQDFGPLARLLGYDLFQARFKAGDTLVVTLYWQALAPVQRNYQVFVHLMAEGDRLIAQHDGAPACTLSPTSGWEAGQVIRDEHAILIPPDTLPGDLSLVVGLYDLITLERLPLAETSDAALRLTELEVTP